MADDDEDRARRAILDLSRAEADLREALLARGVEGVDRVDEAVDRLHAAREAFERVAHPRPRVLEREGDAKSWGSH